MLASLSPLDNATRLAMLDVVPDAVRASVGALCDTLVQLRSSFAHTETLERRAAVARCVSRRALELSMHDVATIGSTTVATTTTAMTTTITTTTTTEATAEATTTTTTTTSGGSEDGEQTTSMPTAAAATTSELGGVSVECRLCGRDINMRTLVKHIESCSLKVAYCREQIHRRLVLRIFSLKRDSLMRADQTAMRLCHAVRRRR